jgi:hypothetical protein
MKTLRTQISIINVGSGYLTPNHKSCGVRAPRNNRKSSKGQFIYEKENQEGWQKEKHQKDFEEKTGLSSDEQTLPYGGSR